MPTLPEIRRKLTASGTLRPVLRFRFWFVPLVLAVLLVVGLWAHTTIERSMKDRVTNILQTTLDADVTALKIWLESQQAIVSVLADSGQVRAAVQELARIVVNDDAEATRTAASPKQQELDDYLMPICRAHNLTGYVITDRNGLHIASEPPVSIVGELRKEHQVLLDEVMRGGHIISTPFLSYSEVQDGDTMRRVPIMFTSAPVYGEDGKVIAALSLRIRPELEFTEILHVARPGETGEAYAFDSQGIMISPSRFEDQLREIGLIPDDPHSSALLTIDLRDPGGNMLSGHRPDRDRSALPLTRMAASALVGQSDVDVDGYRDYRGVPVVGAWTWLPEYGLGVAIEIDETEAFVQLHQLRQSIWILFGLLVVSSVGILLVTVGLSRLGQRYNRAVAQARKLGQYTLEKKLGEGGMGEVYRARHAMLRRPTAIKLLRPDRAGKEATARFEREVQLTSRLTHPNTIAIYDYGRTPQGTFYYAMEYLPGISLEQLVEQDGPQPAARVIHILAQVCGSLEEAHGVGLIHRDIKPANIIVCERGLVRDVAKVLDFGIVKHVGSKDAGLTAMDTVPGTPHYLSPEALRDPNTVDQRLDLYALGAVGYHLLTGTTVFTGGSVAEVCAQHLKEDPERPSARLGRPLPEDLERVILLCLAKDPGGRPKNAAMLREMLEACADARGWDREAAERWWRAHDGMVVREEDEGTLTPITATVVVERSE